MADDLLSQYIDQASIKKQTEFMLEQLDAVYIEFKKINALKITLDGDKSFGKAAETVRQLQQADEKLIVIQAQLEKQIQKTADATRKAADAETELAKVKEQSNEQSKKKKQLTDEELKAQLQLSEAQRKRTADTKNQIREENAAAGSIEQLRAQLIALNKAYDSLSATDRKGDSGQGILKQIQATDAALKELEGETGRFQRRVGDYANAFAGALTPVNKTLDDIKNKINSGLFSGNELNALIKQEQTLSQVTQVLNQEFATTKQQSRAFQEAAAQIGIAFGQDSKVFQQFRVQVGEAVDSLNDIRDSIKLAASDTGKLDKLIGAANAVAGGFGIAQGAAAVFGDNSEQLQQTLVKLNGVMTILNGLQAVQNELKNKDSIIRKVVNFLVGTETKLTQAQAIAQKENAAATNTASTATRSWGTAIKALTLTSLLVILPILVNAMSKLSSSTNEVNKYFGETDAKSTKANESLKVMGETMSDIAQGVIDDLSNDIKGLNDQLGLTPSSIDKANAALNGLKKQFDDLNAKTGFFNFGRSFGDILSNIGSVVGLSQSVDEKITVNQQQQDQIRAKLREIVRLQELKQFEDDLKNRFDANVEISKREIELEIDKNNRILADDKATYQDKLSALKNNLQLQNQIIQQDLNKSLVAAGSNVDARNVAQSDANTKSVLAERNYNDLLKKVLADQLQARLLILGITKKYLDDYAQFEREKLIEANQFFLKQAEERKRIAEATRPDFEGLHKDEIESLQNGLDDELTIYATNKAKEEKILNEKHAAGKISEEQYQKDLLDLQNKYSQLVLKAQVEAAKKQLALLDPTSAAADKLKQSIAEAEAAIANLGSGSGSKLPGLIGALTKAKDIVQTFGQLLVQSADIGITKQLNKLDDLKTAEQDRYQKQLDFINATTLSEQDKAAKVTLLNAQHEAQQEVFRERERQYQNKKAAFEKAATIANIIANTALGVVKAIPNPFLIALAAATGAIELAIAIATPVPHYKLGTKDHIGGLAIVGDGGKNEIAVTPSGEILQTPNVPTVVDMPKHTVVYPDAEEFRKAALSGLHSRHPNVDIKMINNNQSLEAVMYAQTKEIKRLQNIVLNKRELHILNTPWGAIEMHKTLTTETEYMSRKTNWSS
jgi:hypothetical protein